MTLRNKIEKIKVDEVINHEKELDFPEFLRCLRKSLGISRKRMAEELGINQMMIYYKEEGKFKRMPEIHFLSSVSHYFGVSKDILVRKAKQYVDDKG